jgi:hypothetical protein
MPKRPYRSERHVALDNTYPPEPSLRTGRHFTTPPHTRPHHPNLFQKILRAILAFF